MLKSSSLPPRRHPATTCQAQVMSQDGAAGHLQPGIHRVVGDLISLTQASPCPGAQSEFPHPRSGISLPRAIAQTDRQTRMVLCQIDSSFRPLMDVKPLL